MIKIVIVDDHPIVADGIRQLIEELRGWKWPAQPCAGATAKNC
ncbi:hypothetical protein [Parabacteroides sp. AF48-14]|nr:hypothetical protein [Parabacteroides sp. AF48-14]